MEPPKPTARDHMDALMRASFGLTCEVVAEAAGLPAGFGGRAIDFVLSRIGSPMDKSRDAFFEAAAAKLVDLEQRVGALEGLQQQAVAHVIATGAIIAARDSSVVKRQALAHAIVNAGLPMGPNATKRQLFLRFIDELTDFDVLLLPLLADAERWFAAANLPMPRHTGGTGMMFDPSTSDARLEVVVARAFPEYADQPEFLQLRLDEMQRRGLIAEKYQQTTKQVNLHTMFVPRRSHATSLGEEFVRFVSEPSQ